MRLDAYVPPTPEPADEPYLDHDLPEPADEPYLDPADEQEPYLDHDPVTAAVAQYLSAAVQIVDEQFHAGYAQATPYLTASVLVCLSAEVSRQELRETP